MPYRSIDWQFCSFVLSLSGCADAGPRAESATPRAGHDGSHVSDAFDDQVPLSPRSPKRPPEGSITPDETTLEAPPLEVCDPAAQPPESVRVATWNIKAGQVRGLERIVETAAMLDADVLLLQEVDLGLARTDRQHQAFEIAASLGYEFAFAASLRFDDGYYGIATLSRLPFVSAERVPLSNRDVAEHRAALDVTVCVGAMPLRIVNHHADTVRSAAEISVGELVEHLQEERMSDGGSAPPCPAILGGDFNQRPGARGISSALDAGFVDPLAGFDPSGTRGDRRIDFVLARGVRPVGGSVARTDVSDHHAVVLDVELPGDQTPEED